MPIHDVIGAKGFLPSLEGISVQKGSNRSLLVPQYVVVVVITFSVKYGR